MYSDSDSDSSGAVLRYNIVRNILHGNTPDWIPEDLVPLINSGDFQEAKSAFRDGRQDELTQYLGPKLWTLDLEPTTVALLLMYDYEDVSSIVMNVLKGAPDYDIVVNALGLSSTSDTTITNSRCEEIYSNATSDLPLDVMKQIVLHTKGLRQLEKLYTSSPVFACILDDVGMLKVLRDRLASEKRETLTGITSMEIRNTVFRNFSDYVQFVKDNFYNYTMSVNPDEVEDVIHLAIKDDDLEWYLQVEHMTDGGNASMAISTLR